MSYFQLVTALGALATAESHGQDPQETRKEYARHLQDQGLTFLPDTLAKLLQERVGISTEEIARILDEWKLGSPYYVLSLFLLFNMQCLDGLQFNVSPLIYPCVDSKDQSTLRTFFTAFATRLLHVQDFSEAHTSSSRETETS
ncbi:MAG: hypothetical protein G01um101438_1030 [Parcubacteria group bacterium Gr01-1014_38]|nr:MAG: hypothetical protein G01um101438_1030 [Parcubacteria group bacterium Gr01-1014_38]